MATYYRSGVETFAIIGEESERAELKGTIPDGSTFFAVDQNAYYTYYDGQWYETLPEAARLYHDDVGTDTKPIKLVGGVATVVANELAEDSKVVHNTGDETVAGVKTFTSRIEASSAEPALKSVSSRKSTTTGSRRASIRFYDTDDNSNEVLIMDEAIGRASGYNYRVIYLYTPAGSSNYTLTHRAYPDHAALMIPTYYPVDGNNNPQPLSADSIETSGNIAVDPRIVHTTGNETVAGDKSFTGAMSVAGSFSLCRATVVLDSGKWARFHLIPRRTGGRRILFVVRQSYFLSSFNDLVAVYISTSDSGISKSSLPMVLCKYDSHSDLWIQNNYSSTQSIYVDVLFNAGEMPRSDPSEPMDNHPVVGEGGCTAVTTIGEWE